MPKKKTAKSKAVKAKKSKGGAPRLEKMPVLPRQDREAVPLEDDEIDVADEKDTEDEIEELGVDIQGNKDEL